MGQFRQLRRSNGSFNQDSLSVMILIPDHQWVMAKVDTDNVPADNCLDMLSHTIISMYHVQLYQVVLDTGQVHVCWGGTMSWLQCWSLCRHNPPPLIQSSATCLHHHNLQPTTFICHRAEQCNLLLLQTSLLCGQSLNLNMLLFQSFNKTRVIRHS